MTTEEIDAAIALEEKNNADGETSFVFFTVYYTLEGNTNRGFTNKAIHSPATVYQFIDYVNSVRGGIVTGIHIETKRIKRKAK